MNYLMGLMRIEEDFVRAGYTGVVDSDDNGRGIKLNQWENY